MSVISINGGEGRCEHEIFLYDIKSPSQQAIEYDESKVRNDERDFEWCLGKVKIGDEILRREEC